MKFPINYTITKINTTSNSDYPQLEKYPIGYARDGVMRQDTQPKIKFPFYLFDQTFYIKWKTSIITEIIENNNNVCIFKTNNSIYKIEYHNKN